MEHSNVSYNISSSKPLINADPKAMVTMNGSPVVRKRSSSPPPASQPEVKSAGHMLGLLGKSGSQPINIQTPQNLSFGDVIPPVSPHSLSLSSSVL